MRPCRFLPWLLAAFVLAAFALATAGRAAPPAPTDATLRALNIFLDQHGYGLAPAESTASNRQVVEARVNGRDIALIVDTGCTSTSLTRDCADALGLPVQPLPGFEVTGGGRISAGGVAVIQSFQLAGHEINRTPTIRVLPAGRPILGRLRTGRDADGLLGYDYLHLNAAILLVGSDRLLFKPGFSPVPPFDAAMTALGFKAVPLLHQHGELEITGHLNGLPIRAVVDCGAPTSYFDQDFVERQAHITVYPAHRWAQGLDGIKLQLGAFRPGELDMGPISFTPSIALAMHSVVFGEMNINAFFGYDMLAQHRAIIDLGHDILWMQ